MKLLLLSLIIILTVLSCTDEQNKTTEPTNNLQALNLDTSKYALIFKDTTYRVSYKSLQTVHNVMKSIVDSLNKKPSSQRTIQFSQYRFQIVPLKAANGQQYVWVNAFCSTYGTDWRKEIVEVKDGGNCFFNTKVNITTETYTEIVVNGSA